MQTPSTMNVGMESSSGMTKGIENTKEAVAHKEGPIARMIEAQTAKLPSDIFLWAAFGSILGSAALQIMGRKERSVFVGQWAPTFLILGLYNKIVKVSGSDRTEESRVLH